MIQAEEAETFVGRVLSASRDQRQVEAQEELRKTKLRETIGELDLPRDEGEAFQSFLMRYHHAFSLEDGERGETDLIRMEIHWGCPSEETESTEVAVRPTTGGGTSAKNNAGARRHPAVQVTLG